VPAEALAKAGHQIYTILDYRLILVKKLLKFEVMPFIQTIRKHWLKIAVIAAVAVVAIYVFVKIPSISNSAEPFVPGEFLEARGKGAVIAERIVNLSKESIANLSEISSEDEIKNYTSGLNLILKEVERNEKARSEALSLSEELGTMATNLTQVKPEDAAKVGLEAIINELQIVQRLINYNSYIFQLLDVLQGRFVASGATPGTDERVKELIAKMNEEAGAINELNDKYKDLMGEFDKLTVK